MHCLETLNKVVQQKEQEGKKKNESGLRLMYGFSQHVDNIISHNKSLERSFSLSHMWDMIQCLNMKRECKFHFYGSHRASLHYPWFPFIPQLPHSLVAIFLEGLFRAWQQQKAFEHCHHRAVHSPQKARRQHYRFWTGPVTGPLNRSVTQTHTHKTQY